MYHSNATDPPVPQDPRPARVLQVRVDAQQRTASVVWAWQRPHATPNMGSAQRLPSGNVLAHFPYAGATYEVTAARATVWQMRVFQPLQNVSEMSLSYRATAFYARPLIRLLRPEVVAPHFSLQVCAGRGRRAPPFGADCVGPRAVRWCWGRSIPPSVFEGGRGGWGAWGEGLWPLRLRVCCPPVCRQISPFFRGRVVFCFIFVEERRPPTAVGDPPTAVGDPPTAVGDPPTAVGQPPTAVRCPPTAIR